MFALVEFDQTIKLKMCSTYKIDIFSSQFKYLHENLKTCFNNVIYTNQIIPNLRPIYCNE